MKKLVVYTCICGNYDGLVQHKFINKGADYVCFTNNPQLLARKTIGHWTIKPVVFDKLDNTKNARWHKINPHILFPDYEASIWIDGNGNILTDYFYKVIAATKQNLIVPSHFSRKCIYAECEDCRGLKETPENCDKVLNFLTAEHMPKNYGLNETNIIYRKHHDQTVKNIMETWWWCIENNSKRDQLSFTYALWKNGIRVKDISIPNARQDCKNFKFHIHSNDKSIVSHKTYNILGIKIKVKNSPLDEYNNFFVIANDKFVEPLVRLLNEHMAACKFNTAIIVLKGKDIKEFPIPKAANVFYYENINKIKFPEKTDKIIWYGLSKEGVGYLYARKNLLKKSFWAVFGGDLYGAKRNSKNDYVRKNFKALVMGHDYDFYKRQYNVEKDVYQAVIPSPSWNLEVLSQLQKHKKDYLSIQINQSACKHTPEILQKLAGFAKENIKIYTILSYGDMDYKDQILQTGKSLFGNKFIAIDKWMTSDEYARHLSDIDVFIHYDNRQSAFGNICCSMYLGAKIYVRSDLDYWNDFADMNCNIYDINQIDKYTFSEFSTFSDEAKVHNQKIIANLLDMDTIARKWETILSIA